MERFSVSRNPQLLAVSKIPKPEHGTEKYVWAGRPVNPGFDTLEGTREIFLPSTAPKLAVGPTPTFYPIQAACFPADTAAETRN
jgi:hypothetical protein